MIFSKEHLVAGVLLLAGMAVSASELPPSFDAIYRIDIAGIKLGEVVVSLTYENGEYVYKKRTQTKGLMSIFRRDEVTERSRGQVDGGEITALAYHYEHKKRGKNRRSNIDFSQRGKISGVRKGQKFVVESSEKVLDRASVELALMRDAGAKKLQYSVVEKSKLTHYTFQLNGNKKLVLPAGEFSCREYEVVRSDATRNTSICLSEELSQLPIWATHDEKGSTITMSLVRYQVGNAHSTSSFEQESFNDD